MFASSSLDFEAMECFSDDEGSGSNAFAAGCGSPGGGLRAFLVAEPGFLVCAWGYSACLSVSFTLRCSGFSMVVRQLTEFCGRSDSRIFSLSG